MSDRDRVSAVSRNSDGLLTLRANGTDNRLNSRQLAAIDHNLGAVAGKMKASGSADAARTAGDHAHFAGKIGIDRIAFHNFIFLYELGANLLTESNHGQTNLCYLIKHTKI